MNLADKRGLVAIFLKDFLELWLVVIEAATVVELTVKMTVFAGEQRGTAGGTDRVSDVSSVKDDAVSGDAVDVRCQVFCLKSATVSADRIAGVIVRKYPDNVGTLSRQRDA